jgi:hypothetical protein
MTDIAVYLFAIIGAVYLGLTALTISQDRRRRREDARYNEDEAFRRFVDAMKRIEDEEGQP